MKINCFGNANGRMRREPGRNKDEIRFEPDFILQSSAWYAAPAKTNACEAAFYFPNMRQTRPEALVVRYAIPLKTTRWYPGAAEEWMRESSG